MNLLAFFSGVAGLITEGGAALLAVRDVRERTAKSDDKSQRTETALLMHLAAQRDQPSLDAPPERPRLDKGSQ
jgi:hypothetical protein